MTNPKDPFDSTSGGVRGGAYHRSTSMLTLPPLTLGRCAICGRGGIHDAECPNATPEAPPDHVAFAPKERPEDDETPELPEQEEVSCPTCGGTGAVFRDLSPSEDDDPMVLAGLRQSQLDEAIELGRELGQLRRRTGAAKELPDSLVAAMEPNSKGTFTTTESVISAFKAIRAKLTDEAGGAQ